MKQRTAPLQLTVRDEEVLCMVHAYHGCMTHHVHARFWSPTSPLSACYRRVALLAQAGYLTLTRLPSTTGFGSGKAFIQLGLRGRRVVAEHLAIPLPAFPRRTDAPGPMFALHHDAICSFRVALELAVQAVPGVELDEWISEPVLKRSPLKIPEPAGPDGKSGTITIVPDGAFVLSFRAQLQRAFLEMDMGTIGSKRLRTKLRGYLLTQTRAEIPVFFVVPTKRRLEQLLTGVRDEARRLHLDASPLFLTCSDLVTAETVLTQPIWRQAGSSSPVAILPESTSTGDSEPLREPEPHSLSEEVA